MSPLSSADISAHDRSLGAMLAGTPFASYTYSYPHKTAYRPLEPRVRLAEAWSAERTDALFLYFHIPFCEYRCGFCNLFTHANPADDLPTRYLRAMRTEAEQVRAALPDASPARLAIGGGTPTFFDCGQLATLFSICTDVMGADPRRIPVSVEASPATVDREKLDLLRQFGVDRLSIGVQTFDDAESKRLGRPQSRHETERALSAIRDAGFATLNIDLIYGGQGQTMASWLESVRASLAYRPEELYLYPLYVRPLTGLGRLQHEWEDFRLAAYREARQLLLDSDYQQVSFRMFRAAHAPNVDGPLYCCQEDGMVGLGCGARSYTTALHYSTEYAVGQSGVRAILFDYLEREAESFAAANYGYRLSLDDQRRRYAIMSLLQCEGLSRPDYRRRFAADVLQHLPQLFELEPHGLAEVTLDRIRLTAAGIERSDAIGPWLYSDRACRLMESFACR